MNKIISLLSIQVAKKQQLRKGLMVSCRLKTKALKTID